MEKGKLMEEISVEIKNCRKCPLYKERTKPVPGEGSLSADIMFVGEGPGREEDNSGRPFVGPAGRYLEELLAGIGLTRDDVFIGNIVKCRPPNNRVPTQEETEACLPYLYAQIAIIEPKVICILGNTALNSLISENLNISKVRGKLLTKDGFNFFPTYHPAAALYHMDKKDDLKEDFNKLKLVLENIKKNIQGG